MKEQFEILLPLVLAGEASAEQEITFFELLEKDEALKAEYEQSLKIWMAAEAAGFDADAALEKMEIHPTKIISIKKKSYFPAVAACMIALAGLIGFFMWNNGAFETSTSAKMVLVKTGNEIAQVDLPDGTKVWLNRNSQLEYPENFNGNERRVKLKGEGYFDVARDESKPFVTEMKGSETTVLGTEYNLKERGINYELTVTEGKVSFGYFDDEKRDSNPLIVKAGFAAILKDGKHRAEGIKMDMNTLAWKTQKMVFEKASLEYMAEILATAYGKKYAMSEGLYKSGDIEFTGTFVNKTEAEVQAILSESLGITFSETQDVVTIRK